MNDATALLIETRRTRTRVELYTMAAFWAAFAAFMAAWVGPHPIIIVLGVLAGCIGFLVPLAGIVVEIREPTHQTVRATLQRFRDADAAVSPVIGVVLMVAITAIMAAMVFVLATNMVSPEATPQVHLEQYMNDGELLVLTADPGIPWTDIYANGCTTKPATGNVQAGDTISGCTGNVSVGHTPTNSLIWRGTF